MPSFAALKKLAKIISEQAQVPAEAKRSPTFRAMPNPELARDRVEFTLTNDELKRISAAAKKRGKPTFEEWFYDPKNYTQEEPNRLDRYAKSVGEPVQDLRGMNEEQLQSAYSMGRFGLLDDKDAAKYTGSLSDREALDQFYASIGQTPTPVGPNTMVLPRKKVSKPGLQVLREAAPLSEYERGLRDYIWDSWLEERAASNGTLSFEDAVKSAASKTKPRGKFEEPGSLLSSLDAMWPRLSSEAKNYMSPEDMDELKVLWRNAQKTGDTDEFVSVLQQSMGEMPPSVLLRSLPGELDAYKQMNPQEVFSYAYERGFVPEEVSPQLAKNIFKDMLWKK